MPSEVSSDRWDLLLVGAGHGHLHLIRRSAELREAGYRVVLVAPRWFSYSGTASAIATRDLAPERGRVDVAALAARCGVRHEVGLLQDLDPRARTARTDADVELGWDLASFNVGSVVDPGPIVVGAGVLTVKPLEGLERLGESLVPRADGRPVALTVVGAGASGVEIAAHAAARMAAAGTAARVALLGGQLVPNLPPRAVRRLGERLTRLGVDVRLGCDVRELHADVARLADGTRIAHDVAVLATGLAASPLVGRLGLGDSRGIPVGAGLRHRDHENVYAVGDCARFLPRPLPKVGVHGVRQGAVLLEALLARAASNEPPRYVPQRRTLAILDLGDGRGLAVRGRWWWEGRAALHLKRTIDRRWLRQYQI